MIARRIEKDVYEVSISSKSHQHGYASLKGGLAQTVGTVTENKTALPDHFSLEEVANKFFEFHREKSEQGFHVVKHRCTHYYAKAVRRGWTPPPKQQPVPIAA
jgi:hypothetical protein